MAESEASGPEKINGVTDVVKDAVYERARWVQKWIMCNAIPFLALFMFILSYFMMAGMRFQLDHAVRVLLASVLAGVIGVRAARPALQKNWRAVVGNYHPTILFIACLLPFNLVGDAGKDYVVWLVVVAGYWTLAWCYSRQWMMPGEFVLLSIMVVALVGVGNVPLESWKFVLILLVPAIAWLYVSKKRIGINIFLAMLILLLWMTSSIADRLLLLISASAFIAFAVYIIGKMTGEGSSNTIRGAALALISGLLLFIVVFLLEYKLDRARSWWLISGLFVVLASFMRWRFGEANKSSLFLWAMHWLALTVSKAGYLEGHELYFVPALFALLLRALSRKWQSNMLYDGSQIYLLISALLLMLSSDVVDFNRFFFMTVLFIASVTSFEPAPYASNAAWWRDLINPRHVVALRNIGKKASKFTASIPVIGPTLSALLNGLHVISKMKKNRRRVGVADLMQIAVIVMVGVTASTFVQSLLQLPQSNTAHVEDAELISNTVTMTTIGVLFALTGILRREPLLSMLAMLCFVATSAIALKDGATHFCWMMCFISAFGVFLARHLKDDVHH